LPLWAVLRSTFATKNDEDFAWKTKYGKVVQEQFSNRNEKQDATCQPSSFRQRNQRKARKKNSEGRVGQLP